MSHSGKTSLNFTPGRTVIFSETAILKRIIKQIHFLFQTKLLMCFSIELHRHIFYFDCHIHIDCKFFMSTCTNFNKIMKQLEEDFIKLMAPAWDIVLRKGGSYLFCEGLFRIIIVQWQNICRSLILK